MGMSNILPQTATLDQVSAKEYLQQNVFPKLEVALNNLLETIEKNGEFEKYVIMLTDREEREHRALRRRERERDRLKMGDDYQSDNESEDVKEEEEDYDSEDSEYDSEANASELNEAVSDLVGGGLQAIGDGKSSIMRKRNRGTSRVSHDLEIQHRFNALRFLAMNLKSQNETLKPRTANGGRDTPTSSNA